MFTSPRPTRGAFALRLLALVCLGFSLLAAAEPGKRSYDIQTTDAESALKTFSAQSGRGVIAGTDLVAGVKTNRVQGDYTPNEALDLMLADTGLVATVDKKSGTFAVRRETDTERKNVSRAIAESRNRPNPTEKSKSDADTPGGVVKLDTFEVFGRKTLNMDIRRSADDPQPYVVFARQQILESGATNLQDFFKTRLSANAVGSSNEQLFSTGLGRGGNSSINLRGLGDTQTLILVDGRRVAASVTTGQMEQPEVNGIPLSAIERIEVLPATASGVYGGGATGGVVNIVLKRDYVGAELTVAYETPFSSDVAARRVDLTAGWALKDGKTSLFLSASDQLAHELVERDLDLISRGRSLIVRNNPASATIFGTNPPLGDTPNVRSATGANLQLKAQYGGQTLSSPFTFLSAGYRGAATDGVSALIQNAGQYNLALARTSQPGAGGMQVVGGTKTKSFALTARREFSARLAAFAEFRWHQTDIAGTSNLTPTVGTLNSTAPNNPFTANLNISIPSESALSRNERSTTSKAATVGVIAKLTDRWHAEADHSWSKSRTDYWSSIALDGNQTAPISSGAIDVFRDLTPTPLDLSAYYRPGRYTLKPPTGTSRVDTVRLSGDLGRIAISGLVEYRRDDIPDSLDQYSANTSGNLYPGAGQQIASAYVETLFHILNPAKTHKFARTLDLQAALRFDDYSIDAATGTLIVPITTGIPTGTVDHITQRRDALSPTVALVWRPASPLMFRASYGTGFLPPNIRQLIRGAPNLAILSALRLTDPKRGNEPITGASAFLGGSPDLKPEDSESMSAGMVLRLPNLPGLRVSADWSKVEKRNNITSSSALYGSFSGVVRNEDLLPPGKILRDTVAPGDPFGVGKILQVDTGLINASLREVEALDFAVDYEKDQVWGGKIGARLAGTWTLHNYSQATTISPVNDLVSAGTAGNPLRFRANSALTWRGRRWTVGVNSNYYGAYQAAALPTNTLVTADQGGSGRVSSQIYHDVFVRYQPSGSVERTSWLLRELSIQGTVKNVFDRTAPFDAGNTLDFYSYFGDPRGATYVLSLTKKL